MNAFSGNPNLFLLDVGGQRIHTPSYPHEWLMDFGSNEYHDYWLEAVIHDLLYDNDDTLDDGDEYGEERPWTADGVYMDCCHTYEMSVSGTPVKYPTAAEWVPAMNDFMNAASFGLHDENQKVFANRLTTVNIDGYNAWIALDNSDNPPDASLDEGSFAIEWMSGDVYFYDEERWKRQVDIMSAIHNYKVCHLSHTDLYQGETGMDYDGKTISFWDVLWYSLSSFLLGKNEVDNNSYFGFNEGNYSAINWYDEYYIDLGDALNTYYITIYNGNNIYWREFEKGYVYVNPTLYDVSNIVLPETCKQLNHDNFQDDPETILDINTIDLLSHRGTILLKSTFTEPECGNNIIETGETCDGTYLGEEICVSQGYYSGVLGCLDDCSGFDTSGCKGDVNNDGNINVIDIQLCINVIMEKELDSDIVLRADINEDGSVDVSDMQDLINFIFNK